uniref:NADH dehydrogenase [ubiquinone] 1 alpha subcomplex assembly factor 3 n=1 Tax=Daucus carota subsp. sativus TaxID=79200 RepID=A0A165A3Y6_DAUCS
MAGRQRAVATLPTLMRALKTNINSPSSKLPNTPLPSLRRAFSLYDQINLIDNVPEDQLRFQGYTDTGFTVTGKNYEGSVLCIGNLILSWTPKTFADITADRTNVLASSKTRIIGMDFSTARMSWEETYMFLSCSLSIFQTVRPIPEILIIGCGRYIQPVNPELRQFIRSTGMKLEAIDSKNAASTYNILNEEGRIVAAALLPYGVTS